ncbi:MAG: hypothetical protein J1G38_04700 [Clostridiales bacterium]|nr:hypothetical protein [Clostridiales bacterium]
MRRRLVSILLVICLALGIAACGDGGEKKPEAVTLSMPQNLRIIEQETVGVVRWDKVPNAEYYIVTVNGTDNETENTSWEITPLSIDYTVSVVACRKGAKNSPAATVNFSKRTVSVAISGGSECRSGKTLQLTATVTNAPDNGVTWSITSGESYAEISAAGLLTAKTVAGDKLVTVKATSTYDQTASATKVITITAKPELTQEMFDGLDNAKLSYEGYIETEQWLLGSFGTSDELVGAVTRTVTTTMDESSWFVAYQDVNGLVKRVYYEDRDNIDGRASTACKVSVDLMNEETVEPLKVGGELVAWTDVDYTNKLKDLSVADFTFNDSNWRWQYTGGANAQERSANIKEIVASIGEFGFVPKDFYLIVEADVIIGVFIESEDDFLSYSGYAVRSKLTASVDVGDLVNVKKVAKFEHKEMHDELAAAIEKMHGLTSYTTEVLDNGTSLEEGAQYNGYVETVTDDTCYMRPFEFEPFPNLLVEIGNGVRTFSGLDFGFVKCADELYNSFELKEGKYVAARAFETEFGAAKPSFAFAAEIFTSVKDNGDGTKTYYVDSSMLGVATTLYNGLGNEMNIYGIFANSNFRSTAFVPFVTVNADGYISAAAFSYYISSYYGEIRIEYRDFDSANVSAEVAQKLGEIKSSPRTTPTGWGEIEIALAEDDDKPIDALNHFKKLFDDDIADRLPYFGAALGDTFNSGITDFRSIRVGDKRVTVESVTLFFEVPFDINYSIDSSIAKLVELLEDNGFSVNESGVYVKGNISVQPADSQKRLFVYVWNNSPTV